jgi:5'-phosphate synthase pdxT subunit
MKVGVLALQGDFREHIASVTSLGVAAIPVKTASDISAIDALIIPGGESTTISKLAKAFDLFDVIAHRIASGLPTYGSCAGMIMVAREIQDPASDQETFGGIDMVVKRNAFGRQVESFESDITVSGIDGPAFRAVFIRAPWVESYGPDVEILATALTDGQSHPVAVRQGTVFATSFHPELTEDNRIHRYFLESVAGAQL